MSEREWGRGRLCKSGLGEPKVIRNWGLGVGENLQGWDAKGRGGGEF